MNNGTSGMGDGAQLPLNDIGPNTTEKRRRGRPKGSGKAGKAGIPGTAIGDTQPKVKRLVGRPRKKGPPAGVFGLSTTSQRGRRKSSTVLPSASSLKPRCHNGEDWLSLKYTDPNSLLAALVEALDKAQDSGSDSTIGEVTREEAFKAHLRTLRPPTAPIPALYNALQTFWMPSAAPYISMVSNDLVLSACRFLYWDPLPIVPGGIRCPYCAEPLQSTGPIESGPAKIFDLEQPYYVIACQYVCRSALCRPAAIFPSTSPYILDALPTSLRNDFPAKFLPHNDALPSHWNWAPMGVSLRLWNMATEALDFRVGKEGIIELVKASQGHTGSSVEMAVFNDGNFLSPSAELTQNHSGPETRALHDVNPSPSRAQSAASPLSSNPEAPLTARPSPPLVPTSTPSRARSIAPCEPQLFYQYGLGTSTGRNSMPESVRLSQRSASVTPLAIPWVITM